MKHMKVKNKEWEYQQVKQKTSYKDRFALLLQYAGKETNEPNYARIANVFFSKQ